MARVGITDVALRDAHQSLFATRMLTADMLPAGKLMDRVGYWSVETWGGATFDTCIRYLNEDPWERLARLKEVMPRTPQQMLLRGQNLLGYRHYADDVVEAFVALAARRGVDVFRIFDALNDPRNLATSIRAVKKAGRHAQATISYAVTPVHTPAAYLALAREFKTMGADSICIKDMAGLLKPYDAHALVAALKSEIGLPVQVHTHATTGMAVATLLKAIEAGADMVDTAISALAMGTSHSPTETIVEIMRGSDRETGLDLKLLSEVAAYFRQVRPRYRQFESSFFGADTRILLAQVPGGMLSNLESQLREQNALGKLDAVLDEIAVVQRDFGYPPLVTPTSQIVGTQAVLNVLFGRYARLSGESRDLLVGRYGKTPAAPNPDLVKQALAELKLDAAVTGRPADRIPNEFGALEDELKRKLQAASVSPEDVLTYAMFPQTALQFFAQRSKGPVTFEAPAEKPARKAEAEPAGDGRYKVAVNGKSYSVVRRAGGFEVDGTAYEVTVAAAGTAPAAGGAPATGEDETIEAPMPGTIVKLSGSPGDRFEAGATVLVMEAMKMQLEVKTRRGGAVEYKVGVGDAVKVGQILAVIR